MIRYPVPWDLVFGLTGHLRRGTQRNIDEFTRQVVARMTPPPEFIGVEHIPRDPQFLVVANHYQRPGLWILHPAAAITQAIRQAIGPGDPPVHWVVTANWPPLRIGPWRMPSPGDILLPRVARVLQCFSVSFAKQNPALTAVSLRRLLKMAPNLERPIGIFPEGVAGSAGKLTDPLPGVARLIAKLNRPVLTVALSETDRLRVHFGRVISSAEAKASPDAARLAMERIRELLD